jgi:hypothetical protein
MFSNPYTRILRLRSSNLMFVYTRELFRKRQPRRKNWCTVAPRSIPDYEASRMIDNRINALSMNVFCPFLFGTILPSNASVAIMLDVEQPLPLMTPFAKVTPVIRPRLATPSCHRNNWPYPKHSCPRLTHLAHPGIERSHFSRWRRQL